MEITHVHSYLVHPAKSLEEQPEISGAKLGDEGALFEMLKGVFNSSGDECKVEISFNHNAEGEQQNDILDLVLEYVDGPTVARGRKLAKKLQLATTGKSGLGLLFLIVGQNDSTSKFVLSRFPADKGVLAEEDDDTLNVEFLEKVFMKNAKAYKAAVYSGDSDDDFWKGHAVDKQINNKAVALSEYWIKGFLDSDLRTTGASGTRRLAHALKQASQKSQTASVKEAIVAACKLAPGLSGKTVSISSFCRRMNFDDAATNAVKDATKNERLFTQQFRFTSTEFAKHIKVKSVELSNGGIMMANADNFEDVFERELVDQTSQTFRYTTEGQIKDQRLK